MWPSSSGSGNQQPPNRTSRTRSAAGLRSSTPSMPSPYGTYVAAPTPYYPAMAPAPAAPTTFYAGAPAPYQPSYPVTSTDPRSSAPVRYPGGTMVASSAATNYPEPEPISQEAWDTFLATGWITNPPFPPVPSSGQTPSGSARSTVSSTTRIVNPPPASNYSSSSSSQGGTRRSSQLDDVWDEMDANCKCRDRTQKPLRHWETNCPYNTNKRLYYCNLPRCTNPSGFSTRWSLERHQKTVLH